jgi:hypothetical protein
MCRAQSSHFLEELHQIAIRLKLTVRLCQFDCHGLSSAVWIVTLFRLWAGMIAFLLQGMIHKMHRAQSPRLEELHHIVLQMCEGDLTWVRVHCCMYVGKCVCMYVCMCVCMCACADRITNVWRRSDMGSCSWLYVCVCKCVCMYVCMYVCMWASSYRITNLCV